MPQDRYFTTHLSLSSFWTHQHSFHLWSEASTVDSAGEQQCELGVIGSPMTPSSPASLLHLNLLHHEGSVTGGRAEVQHPHADDAESQSDRSRQTEHDAHPASPQLALVTFGNQFMETLPIGRRIDKPPPEALRTSLRNLPLQAHELKRIEGATQRQLANETSNNTGHGRLKRSLGDSLKPAVVRTDPPVLNERRHVDEEQTHDDGCH